MKWIYEQMESENVEEYQSYILTKVLEGKRCPSREGVVELMRKGWKYEKVQSEKRERSR